MINNKCSVPLHATQMHRTYIIQVFLLVNLSVTSAVELLQYVFEFQGKTQESVQLSFWGLGGVLFGIQLLNPCLF